MIIMITRSIGDPVIMFIMMQSLVRRRVLLIDSGVYRNGPTQHMHDVLGFDGVKPAYFRWAARKQISFYKTVSMKNGSVTKIKSTGSEGDTYFKVYRSHHGKQEVLTARKVILGTGLRDLLPKTPGVRENWGNGIYWCAWCDGFEHADQKIGVLKSLEKSIGTVRQILTLNRDIILFTNGTDTPQAREALEKTTPRWQKFLRQHSVKIENRPIKSIEKVRGGHTHGDPSLPSTPSDNLFRVNFRYGRPVFRNGFMLEEDPIQASKIGEKMGVHLFGGRLGINFNSMETNVPGVYAVGDANSDNSTNVPHAFWSGKRAAVSAHGAIGREDYNRDVKKQRKRAVVEDPRTIWNRMNGKVGDLLYAGEFDRL
ncbi:hypothetical protein HRG_007045 [Hirsutella rhossiliensis]|uniref:FAD/NAD(P)-binding domain-containing protein n=1 Tax=Hirsutella rhossiliensis TaxID=111463 RepID=A0A9P8MVF2_9HYPO|nr:uncharacterized protein HRG_07045 [Hirsutella rhossiliensis]KAH0961965.1 hypothetical protein HRG_07045 [Hirsutella rhossiliensis]